MTPTHMHTQLHYEHQSRVKQAAKSMNQAGSIYLEIWCGCVECVLFFCFACVVSGSQQVQNLKSSSWFCALHVFAMRMLIVFSFWLLSFCV